MKKLVLLISNSGTGTNLQAVIDAIEQHTLNATIIAVISDKPDAKGLQKAKKHNLPTILCPKKDALLPLLQELQPDYICLTGWKQIILPEVLAFFPDKILNIHPGLIPDTMTGTVRNPDRTNALWNRGKFTNAAIVEFLKQKATYAGSSIHFLTSEFDFGPVLGRVFEKVQPDDTVDTLYARLKKKENQLYTETLVTLCPK
jgi:phosphoribosylglycinamide formyltransferase-1